MRLYIPTSSLNADNILSCESISPAYECRKRNFGYAYFDVLPVLERLNKVTLAFSKIPTFCTNDTERESFAMIVAVDVDDFEKYGIRQIKTINDVVVFATSTPILLTPSTTQFIFFDNRAKEYTLHSCADSAKCKLFDFYKSNFVSADSRLYGESLRMYTDNIDVQGIEPLFTENRFDKAKGFIWGYGIGTMMSIPKDAAKLLKIQKRIYDIVSSTKNEDYIPASLIDELSRLDIEFSSIDPNQKAIKNAWEAYIKETAERYLHTDIKASEVNEFLKHLGAENLVKNKFLTDNKYSLRKRLSDYSRLGSVGYESYNQDLATYTERLINNERIKGASEPFSQSLDVDTATFDTVMVSANDRASKLFNKILSHIIWDNIIPSLEELRVNKAAIAKNVVIALKSIIEDLGEQWANAPIQLYFNAMRKNISDFTEFNLNEINDIVLQSMAAFLLKGEDFESLKQYLETNAFSDYRYAFALWGALSGYVSISRSIVENNFSTKEIIMLFEQTQLSLKLDEDIHMPSIATTSDAPGYVVQPKLETISEDYISFRNKVYSFFETTIVKRQSKERRELLRQGLDLAFEQFGEDANSMKFVGLLNDYVDYGWGMKLAPWKTLCNFLEPNYREKTARSACNDESRKAGKTKSKEKNLFSVDSYIEESENITSSGNWIDKGLTTLRHILGVTEKMSGTRVLHNKFINDEFATQFVSLFPSIPEDLRKRLIANIRHIQRQYQPDGFYGKRKDSTEDSDVIDHLIRWCTYEKNQYNRIEKTQYNLSILSELKNLLMKHYCG